MPTVYVVQDDPRKNVAAAMEYGSLVGVLDADEEARLLNIPMITAKIQSRLARITPDDYLVLIGNPISIGICCAVAADICGGRFKLLKWDGQETRYLPIAVDLNLVRSHDEAEGPDRPDGDRAGRRAGASRGQG